LPQWRRRGLDTICSGDARYHELVTLRLFAGEAVIDLRFGRASTIAAKPATMMSELCSVRRFSNVHRIRAEE